MKISEKYVYSFTPERKLSATKTRMATVKLINLKRHKIVGTFSWSRKPDQKQIDYMVSELIREEELRRIWNKKAQ